MGKVSTPEEVLDFWFPPGLDADEATHRAQLVRWFRGGTTAAIVAGFVPTAEAASRGELAHWAASPRGRLALILVLDQFSRAAWAGTARAYAQDAAAQALAEDGLDRGVDRPLPVWERMFFGVALGHSEERARCDRAVALAQELIGHAPPELRPLYELAARQARAARDVIARFGRHPHRNGALGRASTADEQAYLDVGDLPHTRPIE